MQFQAVIARDEIIFVDSHGGYAVQDGYGGRIILLAWQPDLSVSRDSLTAPVPLDVVHYREGLNEIQRRLIGEFNRAMALALERQGTGRSGSAKDVKVVSLSEGSSS